MTSFSMEPLFIQGWLLFVALIHEPRRKFFNINSSDFFIFYNVSPIQKHLLCQIGLRQIQDVLWDQIEV